MNKARLQQVFEEVLWADPNFQDAYWNKEIEVTSKKKDATKIIWQVREEVDTKLGGKAVVNRLIKAKYYQSRMAGPNNDIEEIARIKEVNTHEQARTASFRVKAGGNITDESQLKDRINEVDMIMEKTEGGQEKASGSFNDDTSRSKTYQFNHRARRCREDDPPQTAGFSLGIGRW